MSPMHEASQPVLRPGNRWAHLRPAGDAPWAARLSAVLVWAIAGYVTAHWVLAWAARSEPIALPAAPWVAPDVDTQAVARALGAVPMVAGPVAPTPDATGRYALVGVVAEGAEALPARRPHAGVALIATDGQLARPYAVGAQLDGRWVVHAVTRRSVVLRPVEGNAATSHGLAPEQVPGAITLSMPKP